MSILLSCSAGIYTLQINSTYGTIFLGTGAAGVITNSLAIGDCGGGNLAYGGQGTITCIPP